MLLAYGTITTSLFAIACPTVIESFKESNKIFYESDDLTSFQVIMITVTLAHILLPLASGLLSVFTKSITRTLTLITAIILLPAFPLGTGIASYYCWYRYR